MRSLQAVVAALCFTAIPVLAQNTVTVQSRFVPKDASGIDAGCRPEANRFIQIARTLPQTNHWHFVIVCDEPSWTDFIRKSGQNEANMEVFGTTYLQDRLTFIRGWRLTHGGEPFVTPEHIVAHEIAHIVLDSSDERAVDTQAMQWLDKSQESLVSKNR